MQEAPPTDEDNGEGEEYYDEEYYEEQEVDYSLPFPAEIPMDANTAALSKIPLPLFYPAVVALAAAAGLAGAAAGRGMPVSPQSRDIVAYSTAAVVAGAVLYGGLQAKKARDRAAVVDLFNALVYMEDPTALTNDDVKAIGAKYGIDMHKDQLDGLVQVFGQYLEGVVPKGEQQLRGDEAPKIIAFKEALGLSDEEAAPAFIEAGRRLSRAGWEIKDRQAQFEQRKAFQRLIYLSYAVLGDQKAAMLLPWAREFNLNDSQLFVARRDNARAAFGQRLAEQYGGDLPADADALRELREFQASVKLLDDVAEDSVRAAARSHVETQLASAVEQLRAPMKTRDPERVVEEVQAILDYSRKLASLAGEEGIVPGVAAPSLAGGDWVEGSKKRDVRDVYRFYCDERASEARAFTPALDADLKELASILCLAPKDAADLRAEVAAGLYRRLLKDEVTSGRIDKAPSPAQVLGDLVTRSGFSPEAALEMHKGLYRQKLAQLAAKKKLTQEDSQELQRIRRVLCIPQDTANEIAKAVSGKALEEALESAFAPGPRPLTQFELERIDEVISDLKMDREVAKAVFAEAARKKLKSFAGQAVKDLQQNDRKAAALQLKRMIQFNSLVISPLLERVAGTEAAKKELAELMAKAAEEAKKEEEKEGAGDGDLSEEAAAKKAMQEQLMKAVEEAKRKQEEAKAAEAAAAASSSSGGAVEPSTQSAADAASAAAAAPGAAKDAVIDVAAEAPAASSSGEGDAKPEDETPEARAEREEEERLRKVIAEEERLRKEAEAAEAAEARKRAEEEERRRKEEEDKDPVKVMKKMIAASRGEFGEEEKKAQKDINLGNDVDKAVRGDLYKVYLMFSMSGDVVELPVGGVIRKKTSNESRQQEMLRLQQLGDLLGMNQFEVATVHQDLAEGAFKQQAQDALRGPGALNPQTTQYLEEMRKQLQLPEDKANKIIREIRTEVLGASAALEEAGGQKWTVERVLEAHKEGVDVKKALEEPARRVLLRRELDKRLGDGKAEFDAALLLDELPKILGVEQKRVDALLKELIGTRKRMLLVQAVSQHRQKRHSDVVTSLNNLLSAYRARPEAGGVGAVQWGEREELKDLLATYSAKVEDAAKQDELAALFGLSPAERDEARAAAGGAAKQQQPEGEPDEVDTFF